MIRKKFINSADSAVDDCLKGTVLADSRLAYHPTNPRVILRRDLDVIKERGCVTIACGGGSGHEPYASGLVGPNGVSAAICGDIYASPPSSHVLDALKAIYSPSGTLVFCNNYIGDRLNFGMAVERMKAKLESPEAKVGLVYIDDDVALEGEFNVTTGRRGLAGGVLIMQMIGVMADVKQHQFDTIYNESIRMIHSIGTIGVSLYPCSLPGRGYLFEMPENTLEFGLGIHGEPGIERRRIRSAKEIVKILMERLVNSKRLNLTNNVPIVVLLNNLGATSQLEMRIVQAEILCWLFERGYTVLRFYTGAVTTSIDSHGISMSILKIDDNQWLEYLDALGQISSLWMATTPSSAQTIPPEMELRQVHIAVEDIGVQIGIRIAECIRTSLLSACNALIQSEGLLNELDSLTGDGDCGVSFRNAARAIIDFTNSGKLNFARPKALCLELSDLFEQAVGGTTGALYAVMLSGAANAFSNRFGDSQVRLAIKKGLWAITYFGRARSGDRTMVDALHAAANASPIKKWSEIIKEVELAAESTANMKASSGRASYTAKSNQSLPDPGAKAVAIWMKAAYESIAKDIDVRL